jgi:hypothetical protein
MDELIAKLTAEIQRCAAMRNEAMQHGSSGSLAAEYWRGVTDAHRYTIDALRFYFDARGVRHYY